MMRFLQKIRVGGECRFGTWVKMAAPEPIELIAHAGFDFVVVDMEHAPHTFETMYRMVVLAQGLGMSALVRLADASGADVQRVLDAGVDGVLIPRVRSADEARQAVDGMRFPPLGSRGLGITSRAGRWGLDSTRDYIQRGEEEVFRAVQLEDTQALRDVDDILSAPGVNGVFIGQGDLSLTSGKPASHPENQQLVHQALQRATARGIPCGSAVGDAASARRCRDQGYAFVLVSNDLSLFGKAAAELVRSIRHDD